MFDLIKYVDTSVLLHGTHMYSSHKNRAENLIKNPFLTPSYVPAKIGGLHNRRKQIYAQMITDLAPQKGLGPMVGKMPVDYQHHFKYGPKGYHLDNVYLQNLFDDILMVLELDYTHRFNEDTALQFRRAIFNAIQSNKTELGHLTHKLNTADNIFEVDNLPPPLTRKVIKGLKRIVPEPAKHKTELTCITDCILHGVSSGMEFVVISALDCFGSLKTSRKCKSTLGKALEIRKDDCPEITHLLKFYT